MNKQWRSIFFFIGILAIVIVVLLWSARQKAPEKQRMPTQIVQESQFYEVEPRKTRKNPPEQRSFHFFDTIAPIVKPFKELLNITPSNPPYFKGEEQQQTPPLNISPVERGEGGSNVRGTFGQGELLLKNSTSAFDSLPASDPIFKKLYPDYYLDALKVLHRIMVNDEFLPDTSLDTPDEDALFAFLSATIDYAEIKNFIAQTDAERFRKALHGETRELLRKERYSVLYQILDYFDISNAFAGIITGPECYSDPYPFNIIPGVNLPFDYCCNCGLICVAGKLPVFVPDCSIKSCDVPLGCLNLVCPNGNAIWDPLTGICGCDNPISAAKNIPSILKNALNCIAPKKPAPTLPPPSLPSIPPSVNLKSGGP